MKTNALDFIICGFVLGAIFLGSFLCAYLMSSATQHYFHQYGILANVLVFMVSYGLLSGLCLRVLLKFKPFKLGEFSMDDRNFAYWKVLSMILIFADLIVAPITPLILKPVWAMLFGAKIGKNPALAGNMDSPYLTTVGDNFILGIGSHICGNMSTKGKIFFGTVKIGNDVVIGMNAIIMPDVEIGDNVQIGIGSVVMPGTKIPSNQTWRGNPARQWQ